ncbi:hypothetical protein MPL3365_80038 [Mesorhizobium plurifarium]|uniref:Uncharacterized protein n=1 Tax=Mesorhizobium plurifarium TaxID=69974 RepID=A0A090GD73_MESPL|nr:hypothetical protein MPL3365_80038 [Mesorhizobium plurifarium]
MSAAAAEGAARTGCPTWGAGRDVAAVAAVGVAAVGVEVVMAEDPLTRAMLLLPWSVCSRFDSCKQAKISAVTIKLATASRQCLWVSHKRKLASHSDYTLFARPYLPYSVPPASATERPNASPMPIPAPRLFALRMSSTDCDCPLDLRSAADILAAFDHWGSVWVTLSVLSCRSPCSSAALRS